MSLFNEPEKQTIFAFGIDETGRAYMLETARWTKFLAIIGFVFIGLIFLIGFISLFGLTTFSGMSGLSSAMFLGYAFFGGIYLYPTVELSRFSKNIKLAMASSDVGLFNTAMKNQRNMFRFIAILIIILLAFYGAVICYLLIVSALSN
jgi:hypothetical protein